MPITIRNESIKTTVVTPVCFSELNTRADKKDPDHEIGQGNVKQEQIYDDGKYGVYHP